MSTIIDIDILDKEIKVEYEDYRDIRRNGRFATNIKMGEDKNFNV